MLGSSLLCVCRGEEGKGVVGEAVAAPGLWREVREACSMSQCSTQLGWLLPALTWDLSRPGLPAADHAWSCPVDRLFARLGGPQLLAMCPCGLGRWKGGLHALFPAGPENNPMHSSSHTPG